MEHFFDISESSVDWEMYVKELKRLGWCISCQGYGQDHKDGSPCPDCSGTGKNIKNEYE